MHRPLPLTPNTEEHIRSDSRHDYRPMGIYAPFVWLAVMVMRLGLRAGFINPAFLMSSQPKITPEVMPRNRQLRRARVSCMRRARRCHLKHGKITSPDKYTPRAYAYFGNAGTVPAHYSMGQYRENYIRNNDVSRVEFYGMDSAHRVTGFLGGLSERLPSLIAPMGLPASSRLSPDGRAPP